MHDIHSDTAARNNGHITYIDGDEIVEYRTTRARLEYTLDRTGLVIGWDRVSVSPAGPGWRWMLTAPDGVAVWARGRAA